MPLSAEDWVLSDSVLDPDSRDLIKAIRAAERGLGDEVDQMMEENMGDNSEESSNSSSTLSGERAFLEQHADRQSPLDLERAAWSQPHEGSCFAGALLVSSLELNRSHLDVINEATASQGDYGTPKRCTDRCHHRWHYGR
ncbi:hypothetical protein JKP88DRAFT_277666 [Tribonema minus]|uniref:Uncharacterized protein n=1 Tax=Tribonema minus TaxID=303371 RepID=A0A835YZ01_9STRA|nr:hypothetical protein JKP88DRAFT_277666 [Tribonema minus]